VTKPLTRTLLGAAMMVATAVGATPARPEGPCDLYGAADTPCVTAHSTTRALSASYNGPLYQVKRQSDGKTLDVGVVQPSDRPVPDAGGYANAAARGRDAGSQRLSHTGSAEPVSRAPALTAAVMGMRPILAALPGATMTN
jgi:hypothetical protein